MQGRENLRQNKTHMPGDRLVQVGIGFWLLQKHCDCQTTLASKPLCCNTGWHIVLVGSRFTHSAESHYRPIEGEALAVADALDRTRYFVLGCKDLTVVVDHKPLLGILGNRSLEAISNPHLRNLKDKTLRYQFEMMYIPGVKNKASDCMSRRPSGTRDSERPYLEDDITLTSANCVPHISTSRPAASCTWSGHRINANRVWPHLIWDCQCNSKHNMHHNMGQGALCN